MFSLLGKLLKNGPFVVYGSLPIKHSHNWIILLTKLGNRSETRNHQNVLGRIL